MNNININLAYEKGLIKENDYTKYNKISNIYKYLFTRYLQIKINLKKYDDVIKNSNLDFGIMPDNYMSIYQKESYLDLDYIYIRNNFYVEKLDINDINYLDNIDIKDFSVNEDTISFIEKTFKDIINDNFRNGKYLDNTNTCYGTFIPSNIVDSKSLVLCIQYGKNNKQYNDEKYLNNSKAKKFFLNNLSTQMKVEIIKKLDIKIEILIRNFVGEN